MDTDAFLRDIWFDVSPPNPLNYCHRPLVIRNMATRLGQVLGEFQLAPQRRRPDVVDHDIMLVWGPIKRAITGADIRGYLLRDITKPGES